MRYALYDSNGYIQGSGYSNIADANRIATENSWSVIESDAVVDGVTNIVDTTGTPMIRAATGPEQAAHPETAENANKAAAMQRLSEAKGQGWPGVSAPLVQHLNDLLA